MIFKPLTSSIKHSLVRLAKDETGAELVESVLVVGAIAVICLIAMKAVGVNLSLRWSDISDWM